MECNSHETYFSFIVILDIKLYLSNVIQIHLAVKEKVLQLILPSRLRMNESKIIKKIFLFELDKRIIHIQPCKNHHDENMIIRHRHHLLHLRRNLKDRVMTG